MQNDQGKLFLWSVKFAKYHRSLMCSRGVKFQSIMSQETLLIEYDMSYHSEVNYQEELNSRTRTELKPYDWYYGEMTRVNAEKVLSNKTEGAFLVRISESYPSEFALSVKHLDTVQHFRVLRDAQGKFFLWDKKFSSIIDLIDYHRRTSVSLKCDLKLRDIVWKECFVQAKYDFTPQELGELEFKRGEIITVIERANDAWWRGLIGSRKGLFPSSYVTPFHT